MQVDMPFNKETKPNQTDDSFGIQKPMKYTQQRNQTEQTKDGFGIK